ncbi:hypothetical protein BMS3Bbin02_00362 [bacterium BMS3Bbin02]|nr:hypothetical protein BMS3Bbin02_00362 [bacterium BMS3Bbin02]
MLSSRSRCCLSSGRVRSCPHRLSLHCTKTATACICSTAISCLSGSGCLCCLLRRGFRTSCINAGRCRSFSSACSCSWPRSPSARALMERHAGSPSAESVCKCPSSQSSQRSSYSRRSSRERTSGFSAFAVCSFPWCLCLAPLAHCCWRSLTSVRCSSLPVLVSQFLLLRTLRCVGSVQ